MNKKLLPVVLLAGLIGPISGVEIPLESLSPIRIGYVDLQKVFDTFPEKAFAEGDLLKEVSKRKLELSSRRGYYMSEAGSKETKETTASKTQ